MRSNMRDNDLGQTEQAQVALRDGLERARKLVREARLALRRRDGAHSGTPTDIG